MNVSPLTSDVIDIKYRMRVFTEAVGLIKVNRGSKPSSQVTLSSIDIGTMPDGLGLGRLALWELCTLVAGAVLVRVAWG